MTVVLSLVALLLLTQSCEVSLGQTTVGCMRWKPSGDDVCCEECHPGNHWVTKCGRNPKELCKPCEPNTYAPKGHSEYRCKRCTQCVGALHEVAKCTATTDTKCGCTQGICGDDPCTFCIPKCGKGEEPTGLRSCRPCPNGTFNNKTHSKCEPWSKKCPHPGQSIVSQGDAFTDIVCTTVTENSKKPAAPTDQSLSFVVYVTGMVLMAFMLIVIGIITLTIKIHYRRKMKKKTATTLKKTPIIRAPTDDPRTLIAIECSFHEAQQEQGSSTESLASKESSQHLITSIDRVTVA